MARATYVYINGEMIQKSQDGVLTAEYIELSHKRDSPSFYVHSDTLAGGVNGLLNPADGKMYDSKSNFERAVKEKGCRVVGNDWNEKQFKRPEVRGDFNVRQDMRNAVQKVLGSR